MDLDISAALDIETASEMLGGLVDILYTMIRKFDTLTLLPQMKLIAEEVTAKNWDRYKFEVHSLKGPAGYIGASRLHYACYYIQKAHIDQDY